MKKLLLAALMVTGFSFTAPPAASAATTLALDGNDYRITAFCRYDAGDYCSQGDIKNDVFGFEDGQFLVVSFDGGVLGVGGSGDFDENGLSFTASYEVFTDNLLAKYTFDVSGMKLFDIILLGNMDIVYYELGFGGYDKEDETKAFFFGIRQ
ncbi:MAG: hypothetical protein JW832_12845 [Deltaproteobacteria bacterium]|nr:hypothetical protein [Deltaproteobacteria bacterium]